MRSGKGAGIRVRARILGHGGSEANEAAISRRRRGGERNCARRKVMFGGGDEEEDRESCEEKVREVSRF